MQIYEYRVVVGKVFYTPDVYSAQIELRFVAIDAYCKPSLHRFRVCKQIHNEAEVVYATKNLFVLSYHFNLRRPFCNLSNAIFNDIAWLFSGRTWSLIKNVSISFRSRSCAPHIVGFKVWEERDDYDYLDEDERLVCAHKFSKKRLIRCWNNALHCLYDPRDNSTALDPKFLDLDFANAYCPTGCSRLHSTGTRLARVLRSKSLRVLGTKSDEEDGLIEECTDNWDDEGLDYLDFMEKHKVTFNMKYDKWAAWKQG